MIEAGLKMRTQPVEIWLDTGTIAAALETNRYLLDHWRATNSKSQNRSGVKILPPVFIHPTADISTSVIGPYASVGAECTISKSRVENSIIEAGATVELVALEGSFVGRRASVHGWSAEDAVLNLNVGDDSVISLKR